MHRPNVAALVRRDRDGVLYTTSAQLEREDLAAGFATRVGGVSGGCWQGLNFSFSSGDDEQCVRENYARFCRALGAPQQGLIRAWQVHSDNIVVVTDRAQCLGPSPQTPPDRADILMTNLPGVALTTFYADCVPVLLFDPVHRAVANVHAGWRGASIRNARTAVAKMGELYRTDPADLLAAVGPAVCAGCYEVGEEVCEAFEETFEPGERELIFSHVDGRPHVDLKLANVLTLLAAGLCEQNIAASTDCTAHMSQLYFSHRRMGERRGNQIALICLREEGEAK